jgi:MerR family mercuric resistance operon transcriptional regulator
MAGNAIGIGAASRRSGCTIETIRYYERIGLVPKPPRTASRYRVYAPADVQRFTFIRRARELGFTLDETRDLLRLAADVADPCAKVRDVAAGHLSDVRARIADLRKMERLLADAVRQCERGKRAGCPMIDALSSGPSAASTGSPRPHRDRASGKPRSPRPRRRAARR